MGYYTKNGGLIGVGNIDTKKGIFDVTASQIIGDYSGPDDLAYSNFFKNNKSPIDVSNSSYDEFQGTGSAGSSGNTHGTLGNIIDHNESKIWGGYSSASYYTWNNGGSNYSGNANFYAVNSSSQSVTGHGSSGMSSNGRGMTIAYLGDNTPVIVITTRYKQFYLSLIHISEPTRPY